MRGWVADKEAWKGEVGVSCLFLRFLWVSRCLSVEINKVKERVPIHMLGSKHDKQPEKRKEERSTYSILGRASPVRLVAWIPWLISATSLPHRSNIV